MKLRNRIRRGGGASYCKECRHYHHKGEPHRRWTFEALTKGVRYAAWQAEWREWIEKFGILRKS